MAELIQVPGFESAGWWTYQGEAARTTDAARNGSYSALLYGLRSSFGPVTKASAIVTAAMSVPEGEEVPFTFWYRRKVEPVPSGVFWVDTSESGVLFSNIFSLDVGSVPTTWTEKSLNVTSWSGTLYIRLRVGVPTGNGDYSVYIDDCSLEVEAAEEAMAYTEDDAFCTVSDVQATIQREGYTDISRPSQQEVIDFAAQRAGEIQAALALAGFAATPASGGAPIDTTGDDGKAIERMCRRINALLAAGDSVASTDTRDNPDVPSPARAYWEEARRLLYGDKNTNQIGLIELVRTLGAAASTAPRGFTQEYEITDLMHIKDLEW